jgi:hypothetical protein
MLICVPGPAGWLAGVLIMILDTDVAGKIGAM